MKTKISGDIIPTLWTNTTWVDEERRKELTKEIPEQVRQHIKKMRVAANSSMRKCVDGGYQKNEAVGATAIPGGDLGISMALLQMGYTPQKSFNLVYTFVRENNQSYCWHTDTHEGHDDCIIGCGHGNAAINKARDYDLVSSDVQTLLNIVRQKQEDEKADMDMIILNREHNEQGILVVMSTDYTVKPWDQENNTQYFIYDKKRHEQLLWNFVTFWEKHGEKIDYQSLLETSNRQTHATLGLLNSSKGKPMYLVNISDKETKIQYSGQAPVINW